MLKQQQQQKGKELQQKTACFLSVFWLKNWVYPVYCWEGYSLESLRLHRNEAWSQKLLWRHSNTSVLSPYNSMPSAPIQHTRQPWNTKNWGFCQNEVQNSLLPVTPITNSYMMKPRMLFSLHSAPQTAVFGATESAAWCNDWRESRARLCSWFVIPAHPAIPPDGSSCDSGHRDKTVAPMGHWRRHHHRKWAKLWLPEDHTTGQWWSQGWELDQQSVTVIFNKQPKIAVGYVQETRRG